MVKIRTNAHGDRRQARREAGLGPPPFSRTPKLVSSLSAGYTVVELEIGEWLASGAFVVEHGRMVLVEFRCYPSTLRGRGEWVAPARVPSGGLSHRVLSEAIRIGNLLR